MLISDCASRTIFREIPSEKYYYGKDDRQWPDPPMICFPCAIVIQKLNHFSGCFLFFPNQYSVLCIFTSYFFGNYVVIPRKILFFRIKIYFSRKFLVQGSYSVPMDLLSFFKLPGQFC